MRRSRPWPRPNIGGARRSATCCTSSRGGDDAAPRAYAYESEGQSANTGVRTGMRVRHNQFGVGTVMAVEDHGDDFKITVRFNMAGTKRRLAKFAGLEKA